MTVFPLPVGSRARPRRGAEVVAVAEDALALVAQAGREREAARSVPLALHEEAGVKYSAAPTRC